MKRWETALRSMKRGAALAMCWHSDRWWELGHSLELLGEKCGGIVGDRFWGLAAELDNNAAEEWGALPDAKRSFLYGLWLSSQPGEVSR